VLQASREVGLEARTENLSHDQSAGQNLSLRVASENVAKFICNKSFTTCTLHHILLM
jgi:hypothetical protein